MPSVPFIGFRCTEELRNRFSATAKQIGKTQGEVLLPLVGAFIEDPGILETLRPSPEVIDAEHLTKQERKVIHFMRSYPVGQRAKIKQSVIRDWMRWIAIINEIGD